MDAYEADDGSYAADLARYEAQHHYNGPGYVEDDKPEEQAAPLVQSEAA